MSANQLAARRTSRKATLARITAVVASVAMVSMLIINESRAAFTATTDNTGNAFEAATIALSNDAATALFSVPPYMVPGDVATGCLTVTYTGTADPDEVRVYQGGYTDGGTLDSFLNIKIDEVDDCATYPNPVTVYNGFLDVMGTSYASDYGTWNPAGTGETQSYLFTATFSTTATNAEQGDTVTALTFTWETQAGS